ncbi:hypothetical protein [Tsukamurella spumae]|uniref:Uncharacterized protein n=1 Tax=Tsukamurella spumae TaxID=44753 RepID=A0A846WV05_9ACTN|nr:hypothetical protein [Tsukamurella spumae]NKY16771.1 hypothetical protein [Tsukamurella spumae]
MDGYGNNLGERALALAQYMLFLAPTSTWRVDFDILASNGKERTIKEQVPTETAATLADYLNQAFELQQSFRYPLMLFKIDGKGRLRYSPKGHVQVDLKIPLEDLGSAGEIVKSWWNKAEQTWPLTRAYAFSMAQEVLQKSMERRNLNDELKLQTAIAARLRMERGLPEGEGHRPTTRNVATIGWLDRIPIEDVVDASQFAPGVTWQPDEASGYGLLQLGAEPSNFTLEMSDSVHRAYGNPTLDDLRAQVAALEAQTNAT